MYIIIISLVSRTCESESQSSDSGVAPLLGAAGACVSVRVYARVLVPPPNLYIYIHTYTSCVCAQNTHKITEQLYMN